MTVKNILLIDKRVQDYDTIVTATDPEICIPVLFDYYTDTIDDIKARVSASESASASAGTGKSFKALSMDCLSRAAALPVGAASATRSGLSPWCSASNKASKRAAV